jgi:hypothetical protein
MGCWLLIRNDGFNLPVVWFMKKVFLLLPYIYEGTNDFGSTGMMSFFELLYGSRYR